MTRFNFGTIAPIPFELSDYPGLTVKMRVAGSISAGTDDETRGQMLRTICLSQLAETLDGYSGKITKDEVAGIAPELCRTLSDKLTAQTGLDCTVSLVSLSPDERSQKLMGDAELAGKMYGPDYTAKIKAEAEEEAKKTLEWQKTLLDSVITSNDISFKGDCAPPMPVGMTGTMPVGIAEAQKAKAAAEEGSAPYNSEMWDKIRESIPAIPQPAAAKNRPRFCTDCGHPLPQTGNFCPNCGKAII